MSTRTVSAREVWDVPVFSMWNTYERVFVAEYQQHKEIKVQKSGYGKTGYKSCFLRK